MHKTYICNTRKQPYGLSERATSEARTQLATICRWIYSKLDSKNIINTLSEETPRESMAWDCPLPLVSFFLLEVG
jgi:hypothetical protein